MKQSSSIPLSAAFLLAAGLGLAPGVFASGPQLVPVEGVAWNVGAGLEDNLRGLSGKRVTVTLRGGAQMTGRVRAVGAAFLHLEELERREHFDALVRLGDISAVDTRFRTFKRSQ